ncbi:MAG: DNA cytosine methyltransferase [Gemmatimonadota bacterium]
MDQPTAVLDQPTAVFLFAGGGGLYLGFASAGYQPVFASDIWAPAAETFAENSPHVRFHLGDARTFTPTLLEELTGGRRVDVVVGGPPCQGFSTLGDQIQGDPRNALFSAFARVVRWLEPKCVLVENTSYIRSQYAGVYEREVCAALGALGYHVFVNTLNAADYGAPQVRKRAFFFASRLETAFAWPAPTHGSDPGLEQYRTVGETIMDIADVSASADLPNHTALNHSETVLARYRLIPEGGRLPPPQELPPEIRRRNFGNTYKRLHRGKPSLTLVPGNNAFPIHPVEDRSLTPREAARLQGFPDDYRFWGSRLEQCKLVGNAVPVQLSYGLAAAILDHLAGSVAAERAAEPDPAGVQLRLAIGDQQAAVAHPAGRSTGTAISLFTGAGGLTLGMLRAGFRVVLSVDRKAVVARNHSINFPDIPHLHADVTELTAEQVRQHVGFARPDLIFGGPPCQGFSIFGRRRFVNTRGHQPDGDDRNDLVLHFVDLAVALNPRVILMENVKGFLSTPRGDSTYLQEVTARLEAHGYTVHCRLVNAADYGVPQLRERVLLVATERGITFEWPQPKYFQKPAPWQRRYATVGDVISDLVDDATHDVEFSHVPMSHRELVVERYKLIPEGGRLPEGDLPDHLRSGYRTDNVKNFSHVYRRLSRDQPATTMVPGHNAFPVHPTLPRTLTVREAARIQTFPDSMRFVGTRQQQCLLVGNAVPPLLAEVFGQAIAKAIAGNASQPGYKADHYELKAAR